MEYILIIISAVFINNIVFAQFLGVCPFLGVSNKMSTAVGMGGAVLFVITLATIITFLVQTYLLDPLGLGYLQTIAFILLIATLVQVIEVILKKSSPSLYQALGIFLPLMSTNCAVLGVAILVIQNDLDLLRAATLAIGTGLSFLFALVVFTGIREQMDLVGVPKGMKGVPIALVTAGILALAFMGFSGLV
ncbi:MAG: RnfABCDGE type electron transport complex subunit A [Bacteroidales bacterium]|jgi:electron transport complex protein RnfA|nr:RnfABCDGE type electron transport complex subunit A [Bacteroidales bacterium]